MNRYALYISMSIAVVTAEMIVVVHGAMMEATVTLIVVVVVTPIATLLHMSMLTIRYARNMVILPPSVGGVMEMTRRKRMRRLRRLHTLHHMAWIHIGTRTLVQPITLLVN